MKFNTRIQSSLVLHGGVTGISRDQLTAGGGMDRCTAVGVGRMARGRWLQEQGGGESRRLGGWIGSSGGSPAAKACRCRASRISGAPIKKSPLRGPEGIEEAIKAQTRALMA